MPVFEQLLPEPHNKVVMDLLFVLCTWHAFGKLRLHMETTLVFFKETTKSFGQVLQQFYKITCRAFKTKELPREEAARGRRKAAAAAKGKSQKNPKPGRKQGVVWKLFNMCTYKLHALGDYLMAITHFGTSDNYTTQTVRFLHYIP